MDIENRLIKQLLRSMLKSTYNRYTTNLSLIPVKLSFT